jgi:hypothetical protein
MCLAEYGDARTVTRWGIAATRLGEEACVTPSVGARFLSEGAMPVALLARDLVPRIAYAWVPVVGPLIGGLLAGWSSYLLLPALT